MGSDLVQGAIPYVFCADAGLVADWCVEVLGFSERGRWHNEEGTVTNVELVAGSSEVWLDGPVPDWKERTGGRGAWIGFLVEDVATVEADLVARGQAPPRPVDREFGVRMLTLEDPEGHQWGFVQRLD